MTYHQAQEWISKGEALLSSGQLDQARQCFRTAASIYSDFIRSLPREKVRTRSYYGVDAANLLYRAGELEEAEQLAYCLLGEDGVEPYPKRGLEDLLARLWNERRVAALGYELPGSPLAVILSKGRVHIGLALWETVDGKVRTVASYVQRMAAFMSGESFSRRARSTADGRYRALATQPIFGSYRIDLFLAQEQIPFDYGLPEYPAPKPQDIIDRCTAFVKRVRDGRADAAQELVPDPDYRGVMIRLVRNLLPDGHEVGEVELRDGRKPREEGVVLRAESKAAVDGLIEGTVRSTDRPGGELSEPVTGILRAVDLDAGVLRLEGLQGKSKLSMGDESEDSIGQYLNKEVKITVRQQKRRATPVLVNIDFAPAPADE